MEGDVTEKDNVLLGLCCSKNSTTNRTRRKEGFIYRNISQINFHLGFIWLFRLHCRLGLRHLGKWMEDEVRMRMKRRKGEGQSS